MSAVRLKGEVTEDGRLVVELPEDIGPGLVEVIVLKEAEKKPKRRSRISEATHPVFGIWADRESIQNSADFAIELRRKLECRADSRG